ncbi:MAG: class I SAM-dependent methyltransferase [Candidatus Taylorbacteria bacterium]|nr:class I SAM-dependent methyltransferase [Candidatus Taylorbacteria bacterium]
MKFTGQQFIPGKASSRIEQDHLERYRFTSQFVKDKNVLDIACGVGYGSKILKDSGALNVDGVDISEEAIDYARTNYPGIRFLVSDAINYAPNKNYDVIVSHVTIEQIKDYRTVLKNFYNWLTPGGLLIISSPNRIITSPYSVGHPFHSQEFTTKEFSDELERCGFKVTGLYGQRFQRYFRNRYLTRIYKILFKPDKISSPRVSEIRSHLEPRYFVIKATK